MIRIYQSLQKTSDKDTQASNSIVSPSTCFVLTNLAAELCNAARRYAFEDCPKLAADALLRAQLLLLQVRKPSLPLLNTELSDVPDLLIKLNDFNDGYMLVRRHYNSPPMSVWGAPVFHHTVVNKNFSYFDALRSTICSHLGVYGAVLTVFLAYPNKISVLDSFKNFLNMCGDLLLRYDVSASAPVLLCLFIHARTEQSLLPRAVSFQILCRSASRCVCPAIWQDITAV